MNKENIIRIILTVIILIIPLILTMIFSVSRPKTYKFIDEESKRKIAPAASFPLHPLFSDLFSQLGINWCSFCIQNNSYSEEQGVLINLGIRLEGTDHYVTIHYRETKCFPIFKEDIFYDVIVQVLIPKEEIDKHFKFEGDYYKTEGLINFKVYSKLTPIAMVTIYLLFVVAIFGLVKLFISMYKLLVLLKP
jgi:hypothetical protein